VSGKVHIFADDPWWEAEVERYLTHCLGGGLQLTAYQFAELEVCDRETFAFDAAVAGAFSRSRGHGGLEPFGVELFVRFPGRVVLLSPLWLRPPPSDWPLCLSQPLDNPESLAKAVHFALTAPRPDGPGREELCQYLPIGPVAGSVHGSRSGEGNG
jgi:hypothetical protein